MYSKGPGSRTPAEPFRTPRGSKCWVIFCHSSWHPIFSDFGANLAPTCLQLGLKNHKKSLQELPRIPSKSHLVFACFWHRFFTDFSLIFGRFLASQTSSDWYHYGTKRRFVPFGNFALVSLLDVLLDRFRNPKTSIWRRKIHPKSIENPWKI